MGGRERGREGGRVGGRWGGKYLDEVSGVAPSRAGGTSAESLTTHVWSAGVLGKGGRRGGGREGRKVGRWRGGKVVSRVRGNERGKEGRAGIDGRP